MGSGTRGKPNESAQKKLGLGTSAYDRRHAVTIRYIRPCRAVRVIGHRFAGVNLRGPPVILISTVNGRRLHLADSERLVPNSLGESES